MSDPYLDELRKKRLSELQGRASDEQQREYAEQEQLRDQIHQLEDVLKIVMSRDAYSRYANIRAADENRAMVVLANLAKLIQQNPKIRIDDKMFRSILERIAPKKRDIKIVRK